MNTRHTITDCTTCGQGFLRDNKEDPNRITCRGCITMSTTTTPKPVSRWRQFFRRFALFAPFVLLAASVTACGGSELTQSDESVPLAESDAAVSFVPDETFLERIAYSHCQHLSECHEILVPEKDCEHGELLSLDKETATCTSDQFEVCIGDNLSPYCSDYYPRAYVGGYCAKCFGKGE